MPSQRGPALPAAIALPSEIDYSSARRMRGLLAAALATGLPALIIDLTNTEFCDSAGIAELAHAHRLAATHGTRIHLVVPPGPLTRLFDLTGLREYWNFHPTVDAALTASTAAPEDRAPAS